MAGDRAGKGPAGGASLSPTISARTASPLGGDAAPIGRLGVVVQARLGSTRLPRKALLPIAGRPLLDMVLSRLALVPADVHVLATDAASADEFASIAARQGFALLVGPAEDVLARYCEAIRRYDISLVLRATGDNPLVSHESATELAMIARGGARFDYLTHGGMPVGTGTELVRAAALLRAEREASAPAEREHVCPYIYGHPELFTIMNIEAPPGWLMPGARVTVDTSEDYARVLALVEALDGETPISTARLVMALRAEAGAAA